MGTAAELARFPLGSPGYIMQEQKLSGTEVVATTPAMAEIQLSSSATATPPHKRLVIILSLISLYTLWGGTYLGMRIALEGFPPFFVAGFRQLIAGIILYVFLRLRGAARPTRAQWLGALVVGGLLLVVGNGGVVYAEQWVSSGLAALALGAIPLWAALFSGLFGRWPLPIEWCGLAIGFAGLVLLNLET